MEGRWDEADILSTTRRFDFVRQKALQEVVAEYITALMDINIRTLRRDSRSREDILYPDLIRIKTYKGSSLKAH